MSEFVKPRCQLVGENSNIFNLVALVGRCLRKAGYPEKEKELKQRLSTMQTYDEALLLIKEYVEIE